MKKFYNFINNSDTADLYMYDAIGTDEFYNELSAKDFKDELSNLDGKALNIHFNCPGGSVFEGNTIANLIKSYNGETVAIIEGLCASIATQIALACDKVLMYKNALFMIHRASVITYGNSKDLMKQAQDLDVIDGVLAQTYADKTKLSMDDVLNYMDNETWFDSKQCKDLGLIDNIIENDNKMVAKFDVETIKNYKNIPKCLLTQQEECNCDDCPNCDGCNPGQEGCMCDECNVQDCDKQAENKAKYENLKAKLKLELIM